MLDDCGLAAAGDHAELLDAGGARLIDGIAAPAWGLDADNDWRLLAPPTDCADACYAEDGGGGGSGSGGA